MLALKLALALAILAAGAVGGGVPLRGHRGDARLLGWGSAFAAGIFLGAGLIHMLPDAVERWNGLGWSYPGPFLLAALAFALMLLVEHVLLPDAAHELVHAPSGERFASLETHESAAIPAYTVVAALSIHSFLAGLALGAQHQLAGALVISLAILAHKSAAGFALGVSLVRHHTPRRRAWALVALFSVATPVGIIVGMAVGQALEGSVRIAIEATFLALAAGTFVYVATLDILRDELAGPGRTTIWLLATGGVALMGALAIWV